VITLATFVVMLAAVSGGGTEVTALERWLPTITSIGGVLVIALATAFKVGSKFNALQTEMRQLRDDYGELREGVKELRTSVKSEFVAASQSRKELRGVIDDVRTEQRTEQTKQGKDIEHREKLCNRRHPPTPPREWMPPDSGSKPGGL
jgi:hypothetical protein